MTKNNKIICSKWKNNSNLCGHGCSSHLYYIKGLTVGITNTVFYEHPLSENDVSRDMFCIIFSILAFRVIHLISSRISRHVLRHLHLQGLFVLFLSLINVHFKYDSHMLRSPLHVDFSHPFFFFIVLIIIHDIFGRKF